MTGKRGRPPIDDERKQHAHNLIQVNPTLSMRRVAGHVGVSCATMDKWFKEWNLKRWRG